RELAEPRARQAVVVQPGPDERPRLEALLAAPSAFLVGIDGVTDPQNLGAILRTAEITGASGVVLPRHRAVRVTPAVTKAAAGAIEDLPLAPASRTPPPTPHSPPPPAPPL